MKKLLKVVALKALELLEAIDSTILNSRVIVRAAVSVYASACAVLEVMAVNTEHQVRLYSLEGKHLSRRNGLSRMTWYSKPITAIEIGEHMGGLTGRLVYIDLSLNITSPYSYRFYKRDDEAYTLTGDLMEKARRNWKYATRGEVTIVK